ncbi:ribonuclease H [Tanacetum coccineum]|uniref:Ribonuclease H n=1 Tax=Tanacetum coccineum TaxID=301880 RepID=A0ABQ5JDX8_9ASTR
MNVHNRRVERKNSEGKSGNSHDHFILPTTSSCSRERNSITHNTNEGKSTDGNNMELSQINESSKQKLDEEEEGVSGVTKNCNPISTLNIMGQKELKTSNGDGLELDTGRNLECSLNKSIKAQADVENTILSKSWKRCTREETHSKSTSGTRSISIVGKRSFEELDNGDQMDVDIGLGNPWTSQHMCSLVNDHNPTIMFLMETRLHGSEGKEAAIAQGCWLFVRLVASMSASGVKFTWSNCRRGNANGKKRLDKFLTNSHWFDMHQNALFENLARIASDHSPIICRISPMGGIMDGEGMAVGGGGGWELLGDDGELIWGVGGVWEWGVGEGGWWEGAGICRMGRRGVEGWWGVRGGRGEGKWNGGVWRGGRVGREVIWRRDVVEGCGEVGGRGGRGDLVMGCKDCLGVGDRRCGGVGGVNGWGRGGELGGGGVGVMGLNWEGGGVGNGWGRGGMRGGVGEGWLLGLEWVWGGIGGDGERGLEEGWGEGGWGGGRSGWEGWAVWEWGLGGWMLGGMVEAGVEEGVGGVVFGEGVDGVGGVRGGGGLFDGEGWWRGWGMVDGGEWRKFGWVAVEGKEAAIAQGCWLFVRLVASMSASGVKFTWSNCRRGVLPRNNNKTLVTLIPKFSKPESLKDLHPISLCNVLYKIILKVLVSRIKPILPNIIQENQSAFVSDRVITDNAIIAFEVFHWLKKKKDGRKGALALKIDMSKAYDRVEWPFIQVVISKFGFPSHFSNLIVACDSLVSLSFNINGQVSGHVTPTRGLRQGDSISPYIFVMCTEVLSFMIRKSVMESHIHGVKDCRGAPEISHLFLADDNIFFTRSSVEERMPFVIGRSKKVGFQDILDKIKKKLGGWKEKTVSIAGKEVLIKSVAQTMPMYIMNIFLLPGNLIDDIHKSLNVYWWGDGVKENPIRWCKWERMCVSKFRGGLGFRHLGLFNRALLAKQIGYRPSYIWRSFLSVKDIVHKGCKWNIGNSRSVNIWNDFWVDEHRSLGPKPNNCDVDQVRDLLNIEGDGWSHELLSSLFPHDIATKIASFFVSKSRNDVLYWHNNLGGRFSCKSAYLLALEADEDMDRITISNDLIEFWRVV